jgi:hypothetical protein
MKDEDRRQLIQEGAFLFSQIAPELNRYFSDEVRSLETWKQICVALALQKRGKAG